MRAIEDVCDEQSEILASSPFKSPKRKTSKVAIEVEETADSGKASSSSSQLRLPDEKRATVFPMFDNKTANKRVKDDDGACPPPRRQKT